jgi:hypothetical protein
MNLDLSEYTAIDDMIIIHWEVNKPIETIDKKFKKLIFSNYNDININTLMETKNNFDYLHSANWKKSLFNQPVNLTNFLTHLIFGYEFNQQITLTNSLTHLTFGWEFNQPVILTNSLTHLTFGSCFNQPIILTNSLTHLTLRHKFNQSIELANIKYLNINCNNLHLIENLPNSLKELILNHLFDLPLNNLPNSIKFIQLPYFYNKPLLNIPINLKTIKCSKDYKFIDNLTNLNIKNY